MNNDDSTPQMNILHICSDYPGTPVYYELLKQLSRRARQSHTMYVPLDNKLIKDFSAGGAQKHRTSLPLSSEGFISPTYDYRPEGIEVIYSKDFRRIDRFLYHRKCKKVLTGIQKRIDLNKIDLVHTHYLFSGGGVAYRLKKQYNIEYISVVRNADLNYFFRYAVHLRNFGIRIMSEAKRLVFISPAHRDKLIEEYVPQDFKKAVYEKSIIVPNGIDAYWLENKYLRPKRGAKKNISLLFVGEFKKNKNIETIIKTVKLLRRKGYDTYLSFVGDGPHFKTIKKLAAKCHDYVNMTGWIQSKPELMKKYRKADIFIMPSKNETFGLVYVEAMTQGLPLIYTKGQGIDGYFEDSTVGYACNALDFQEIADRILNILERYDTMSANAVKAADAFSWDRIARQYEEIYTSIRVR